MCKKKTMENVCYVMVMLALLFNLVSYLISIFNGVGSYYYITGIIVSLILVINFAIITVIKVKNKKKFILEVSASIIWFIYFLLSILNIILL